MKMTLVLKELYKIKGITKNLTDLRVYENKSPRNQRLIHSTNPVLQSTQKQK